MHQSLQTSGAPDRGIAATSASRTPLRPSLKHIGILLLSWAVALAILAAVLTTLEWERLTAAPDGRAPNALVITAAGCAIDQLHVPAISATQLAVSNSADEPMVLTFPSLDTMLTVAPGQHAMLNLPALPQGKFVFACLSETSHKELEASVQRNAFICGLDAAVIARRALTSGTLFVDTYPAGERT
jgi:hypothetical protein